MRAIRKINNNAAICTDGKGTELVALGRGIGFGQLPREITLAEIDRTFYGVDPKYLGLIGELPDDVLEFSGQLADVCRATLSYELSPNLPITLADHMAFLIKLGGQALAAPGPLLHGEQLSRCDLWVSTVPGHKDAEAASAVARRLCLATGEPVSVVAGIHVDHATAEQVRALYDNCLAAAEAAAGQWQTGA